MRRPLKNKRPLGPLFDPDFSDSEDSVETTQERVEDGSEPQDPITKQAEDWYESISQEKNKRKMMRNYLKSVTDLPDDQIQQKLDQADL